MAVDHYENFPVASILLPAHMRRAVEAIYRFARSADDLADEGDASAEQRIAALNGFAQQIGKIEQGQMPWGDPEPRLFGELAQVIGDYGLSTQPFLDLLSAFSQDITTRRYARHDMIIDYCQRSANPVGRLMLALHGITSDDALVQSDRICTALQLINFYQDVAVDWQKDRIYIAQEDLQRFDISEEQIGAQTASPTWRAMMAYQTDRARRTMHAGAPLAKALGGRFGVELRMIIQGGLRILEKIDHAGGDVFRHRPTLRRVDWLILTMRAITMSV